MPDWMQLLLDTLALPQFGLSTVFLVALVSATLLPLGSEPAVFGLVQLNPQLFWPAIAVATVGNTLGGAISWWMGRGAHQAWQVARQRRALPIQAQAQARTGAPRELSRHQRRARIWLRRWGARACLLSWLPVVGDPLCAVAGWLRLPFWPCLGYMAVGKFLRYLTMTWLLLHTLPAQWLHWLSN
ncbi:YqaA family protein [Melaminivora sp.]